MITKHVNSIYISLKFQVSKFAYESLQKVLAWFFQSPLSVTTPQYLPECQVRDHSSYGSSSTEIYGTIEAYLFLFSYLGRMLVVLELQHAQILDPFLVATPTVWRK